MAKVGPSAKFCVVVCKSCLLWYQGDPLVKVGLSAKCGVLVFKASLLWYWGGGSIGQSRVICQVLCSGMQVISALVLGGPLARLGFVLPSLVYWYLRYLCSGTGEGGPMAKVRSSAKFGVVVCKSCLLWYQEGPLVKVGLSAKCGVLVFKASLLWY